MKLWWTLMLASALGCGAADESTDPDEPSGGASQISVAADSYPLQYFAARIGGDAVAASFPGGADIAPADWSPSSDEITWFQAADVIVINGAGFASWTERVTLPPSRTVDTSSGFTDRFITVENVVVHSHGPEGEHSHGETASWTWLDPTLAIEQAAAIRDALAAARPDGRPDFVAGFDALRDDLLVLDERMAQVFEQADGGFAMAGSVFAYLSRRYELDALALPSLVDGGFGDDDWHDVEHALEDDPKKWLLSASPLSPDTETRLAGLSVSPVIFVPADRAPAVGDYLTLMESNIEALEGALTR